MFTAVLAKVSQAIRTAVTAARAEADLLMLLLSRCHSVTWEPWLRSTHSPAAVPCASAVRAFRSRSTSSSSRSGAGVSATCSANATGHPVFSRTCSRVTPGCRLTTCELLRVQVRRHGAEIGHEQHRAFGRDAHRAALATGQPVPERRHERQRLDEGARVVSHDDEDAPAAGRDLGGAAAAGQSDFGLVVRADHRAVQIAEAIDLRAAEEADRDPAALQPGTGTSRAPRRSSAPSRTARRRRSTAAARSAWSRSCRTRRRASAAARASAARDCTPPTAVRSRQSRRRRCRSARAAATVIISEAEYVAHAHACLERSECVRAILERLRPLVITCASIQR